MKPRFHGLILSMLAGAYAADAHALTLHDVNKSLLAHPEAQWSARDTGAAATFRGRQDAFGLPAGYTAGLDRDLTAEAPTPPNAPAAIDWRNKDGVNWVSPIKNQGRCGSCVAFASVAAFESTYNIAGQSPGLNFDGSEQDLFGRIGTCDMGSWPSSATQTMRSRGVADEACYPYASGRLGEDQSGGACADAAARSIRLSGSTETGVNGVKAALQRGPVITTFDVYEDFMYYGGGVYRHVSGAVQGGHAVAIVGYDDNGRYWIIKNSWGEDWGEHGFARISYDDDSGVGQDNYGLAFAGPDSYVKLVGPQNYAAVAGAVTLTAAGARDGGFSALPFTVTGKSSHALLSGNLDPRTMQGALDTTGLDDGVYELKVGATTADGRQSRPWYSLVTVANHPQAIDVALSADGWDASQPVQDRVYFMIDVRQQNVPLTAVDILIAKADGTLVKSITLQNPGTRSRFGWRTAMYANGAYSLKAVGRIGGLQAFDSNVLGVKVAN